MLRELHTTTCLQHLQVDLRDKLVKLSFCPFCTYAGGNNLSYLNHIITVHYNASYRCGKCLKQAFVSSLALHNHKKVCLRLASKKSAGVSDGKPTVMEAIAAMEALPRPPLKRMARLPPPIPKAQAPLLPLNHHHATVGGRPATTTSPTRRLWARRKRRRMM